MAETETEDLNGLRGAAALIEAVFFLETDPLPVGKLAQITGLSEETVGAALPYLSDSLKAADRGLELSQLGGGWFLMPKATPPGPPPTPQGR